jgi:hypothetical protein
VGLCRFTPTKLVIYMLAGGNASQSQLDQLVPWVWPPICPVCEDGEAPVQIGVQCRYASKLSTQNHIIAYPHLFWTDFNQNQNVNVNKFCFYIHLKNHAFINSISFKHCNICGSHPSCQQCGDLLPKLRPQIVTRNPFSALLAFMPRQARSCPSGPLD